MNIWDGVDHLLDGWTDLDSLRDHRLQLLAARRWRERGVDVPAPIMHDERAAIIHALMAPVLLQRIRNAVDGPIILFKGTDLAARFPDPTTRPYGDLDILVPDATAVHAAMMRAGFVVDDDEVNHLDSHNLVPLRWPGTPLPIEVHQSVHWVTWAPAPNVDELFARAVPSRARIDGYLGLAPEHYALILAAHAWRHHPLADILHLLDIALIAEECDPVALRALARSWQLERMWLTTEAAYTALFRGGPTPRGVSGYCVRQLRRGEERRAFEYFALRWLSALWAQTPRQQARGILRDLGFAVRARPNKSRTKMLRELVRSGTQPMLKYYRQYENSRSG